MISDQRDGNRSVTLSVYVNMDIPLGSRDVITIDTLNKYMAWFALVAVYLIKNLRLMRGLLGYRPRNTT